jgi:hypothetical protein
MHCRSDIGNRTPIKTKNLLWGKLCRTNLTNWYWPDLCKLDINWSIEVILWCCDIVILWYDPFKVLNWTYQHIRAANIKYLLVISELKKWKSQHVTFLKFIHSLKQYIVWWNTFEDSASTPWVLWFPHILPQYETNLKWSMSTCSSRIPCLNLHSFVGSAQW